MDSPRFYLLICFLLSATCLPLTLPMLNYSKEDLLSEDALFSLFRKWMHTFDKRYSNGSAQELQRYEIFKANLLHIEQQNLKNQSYWLGLNGFADLTVDEFKSKYCGLRFNNVSWLSNISADTSGVKQSICNIYDLPSSFDWRDNGVVTSIKNQGKCGSCWAFAVVGATESMHALKSGELVDLSEQELVSCDYTNSGCGGGYMDKAYEWVMENGGLTTEEDYPYVSSLGENPNCNEQKAKKFKVTIDNYVLVRPYDEAALLCAVAKQPVVVGIHASTTAFQMYGGGIFYGQCLSFSYYLDHAVLVVGWGSQNGRGYWIVKNSWGREWGDHGYIYMARNTPNFAGTCGINITPSYPLWEGWE